MDRDCGLFYNTGAGGAACRSGAVKFGCLDAGRFEVGYKKARQMSGFSFEIMRLAFA